MVQAGHSQQSPHLAAVMGPVVLSCDWCVDSGSKQLTLCLCCQVLCHTENISTGVRVNEAGRWKETVKGWWESGSTGESLRDTDLTVAITEALVPRLYPSLPKTAPISSSFMRASKLFLCLGKSELSFCCLHQRVLADMVLFPHSPVPTGQAANERKECGSHPSWPPSFQVREVT